jgi:hypothetical protein
MKNEKVISDPGLVIAIMTVIAAVSGIIPHLSNVPYRYRRS